MKSFEKICFLFAVSLLAFSGCESEDIQPLSGSYLNAGVYLYKVGAPDCYLLSNHRISADFDAAGFYGQVGGYEAYKLNSDVNVEVIGQPLNCEKEGEAWAGGVSQVGGTTVWFPIRDTPYLRVRLKNDVKTRQVIKDKKFRFDAGSEFYVDIESVKFAQ